MKVLRKKIGTQIDPLLHAKLKVVAAVTGRRMDAIVEEALRQALAGFPAERFSAFEDMHARYERLHGMRIDLAEKAGRRGRRRPTA